jgi:formamidopyrimidine-DNA glycosylase
VIITLDDGRELRFEDVRKFGEAHVAPGADWTRIPDLARYGPEPLSPEFTRNYLREALRRRPGKIKLVLMDQKLVAGLGNIYTDEALWRARVHPMRAANTLTAPEVARLHRAIRALLHQAIERGGTSARDETYRDVHGRPGYFALDLAVYQRTGQPCLRCGAPIARLPLASGRAAHFCPRCQAVARSGRKRVGETLRGLPGPRRGPDRRGRSGLRAPAQGRPYSGGAKGRKP